MVACPAQIFLKRCLRRNSDSHTMNTVQNLAKLAASLASTCRGLNGLLRKARVTICCAVLCAALLVAGPVLLEDHVLIEKLGQVRDSWHVTGTMLCKTACCTHGAAAE